MIMSKLRVELNNFDPNQYINEKTNKIKTFIQTHSFNGVILGLHSLSHCSLTALLCSRAIGGSNVYVLNIISSNTRYQSKIHNINKISKIGKFKVINFEITKFYNFLFKNLPDISFNKNLYQKLNVKSDSKDLSERLKMVIVNHYSDQNNYALFGNLDKNDLLTNNYVNNGINTGEILVLHDLYKTQIRKLLLALNLGFLANPTQPDLNYTNTDLGLQAETIDCILLGIEKNMNNKAIASDLNIDINEIDSVQNIIKNKKYLFPYMI